MRDKLYFLGPVKGNNLILSTIAIDKNGRRSIIDPGRGMMVDEKTGLTTTYGPNLSLIQDGKKINRVMVTHGHMDHDSYISVLCNLGLLSEGANVWATPQTNEMINIVTLDDMRKGVSDFNFFDYVDLVYRQRDIPKPGENNIDGETWYMPPNGHMPGSTSFMFRTRSGRVFLFLGDVCWHRQALVQGGFWPSDYPKEWIPDEMTTDLTYASSNGEEDKRSYIEKRDEFLAAVKEHIQKGKTVVVQGFASGKIPNCAHDLAAMGIPCCIDSAMAWKVLNLYHLKRWSDRDVVIPAPGESSGIFKVEGCQHRQELMEDGNPKVILATAGMGDWGRILDWYEYGLPRENFSFFATSWLAPGSNAKVLVDLAARYKEWKGNENNRIARLKFQNKDSKEIEWKNIPVRAHVQRFGLSSHGTFGDFIHFLTQLIDVRKGRLLERIFLTHGTEEGMKKVQKQLKMFAKEVIPGHEIKTVELI